MKLFTILVCLVVLFAVADSAIATPDGEVIISADGGFRFATIPSAGPMIVEALADGTAAIRFISSIDGAGAAANSSRRNWPAGVYGVLDFNLRSNIPRPFVTAGDRVDSCYVNLVGATEVIITWTND